MPIFPFSPILAISAISLAAAAYKDCAADASAQAWTQDAEEEVTSEGLHMLQVKAHDLNPTESRSDDHRYPGQAKNCSTRLDGPGSSADVDEYGYLEVALDCCHVQMEIFIKRLVQKMKLQVCNEDGIKALAPWFDCDNLHSLKYMEERVNAGLPENSKCPFVVHMGSKCPEVTDGDCDSHEAEMINGQYFWQLYQGKDVDPEVIEPEEDISSTKLQGRISDEGGFGGWTTEYHKWQETPHVIYKNDSAANLLARLVDAPTVKTYLKSKWTELKDTDVDPEEDIDQEPFMSVQHHNLYAQVKGYAAWVQRGETVHYKSGNPLELLGTLTKSPQLTTHVSVPQGFALPLDELLDDSDDDESE
mmetsp:Transcript_102437/g.192728  ORF Transcript_102437/g.192728 Transcript_102437/m.192728 type:complete len:361 (-) Transcript_102437:164-1246(-)